MKLIYCNRPQSVWMACMKVKRKQCSLQGMDRAAETPLGPWRKSWGAQGFLKCWPRPLFIRVNNVLSYSFMHNDYWLWKIGHLKHRLSMLTYQVWSRLKISNKTVHYKFFQSLVGPSCFLGPCFAPFAPPLSWAWAWKKLLNLSRMRVWVYVKLQELKMSPLKL